MNLKTISEKYQDKLKRIKVALFDVDGILTDGHIHWAGEEVGFNRSFHIHDGYGMKMLNKAGVDVGIITGGNSLGVVKRFELLGLKHIHLGNENKVPAFEKVLADTGVDESEVLYMGDEFFDLPILKRAGFSATVSAASQEIQDSVDYVTHRPAGKACVREVIDMLCYAQNISFEKLHQKQFHQ